ncbi:hypothetical protein SBA5_470102 [Candidatus Sulfotelmatomonas gaucii]|uniref:Uncharacterized protein n=1 Tax=Candidatus Sulfuritelmatomonas gaucii TaxID=2043161 RepID=A0A2N9LNZ9_9BACT|nr:hypothetical protein SBA5_470102 [Candidatus Sulfotelmatomonas gaucii]
MEGGETGSQVGRKLGFSILFEVAAATIKRKRNGATTTDDWAQVAERLMAADCKSAAPCELRRFESSPVHQKSRNQGSESSGT